MKKLLRTLLIMIVLTMACVTSGYEVQAASKNQKAYKAYYNAIANNQTIRYSSEEWEYMEYLLADINSDGIKELILYNYDFAAYGYVNGKVKKILTGDCPDLVYAYDSKNHRFWMFAEGDGVSLIGYKMKNGKLREYVRYLSYYSMKGKLCCYKKSAGKSKVKISAASINKQVRKYNSYKQFKYTNKSNLLKTLKKKFA